MAMTEREWDEYFFQYKKCDFEHLRDYVLEVKPEYEKTLRANIMAGMSYLEIKKAFDEKYYPDFIPVGKPKKPSMMDWAKAKK